jgi:hypothetical protein
MHRNKWHACIAGSLSGCLIKSLAARALKANDTSTISSPTAQLRQRRRHGLTEPNISPLDGFLIVTRSAYAGGATGLLSKLKASS